MNNMEVKNHILQNTTFKRSPNTGGVIKPTYLIEKWEVIENTNNRYSISSIGRVRNNGYRCDTTNRYYKPKILKQGTKDNLYRNCSLGSKSTCNYVHILVARAFIPNLYNLPCVNHKDGDRQNNRVANLEWATYSENQFHGHRELDNYEKDAVFDKETGIFYANSVECAEAFNFSKGHFRNLLNIGDKTRYIEAKIRINKRFVRLQYLGIAL